MKSSSYIGEHYNEFVKQIEFAIEAISRFLSFFDAPKYDKGLPPHFDIFFDYHGLHFTMLREQHM